MWRFALWMTGALVNFLYTHSKEVFVRRYVKYIFQSNYCYRSALKYLLITSFVLAVNKECLACL